jgi:hypothetical protein
MAKRCQPSGFAGTAKLIPWEQAGERPQDRASTGGTSCAAFAIGRGRGSFGTGAADDGASDEAQRGNARVRLRLSPPPRVALEQPLELRFRFFGDRAVVPVNELALFEELSKNDARADSGVFERACGLRRRRDARLEPAREKDATAAASCIFRSDGGRKAVFAAFDEDRTRAFSAWRKRWHAATISSV